MPQKIFLTLGAAVCLVGGQALAAKAKDPCGKNGDDTACFVKYQNDVLDVYGLATAGSHLAASEQIRRAIFVNGYSQHLVAVEFVRPAGSEPIVRIYAPHDEKGDGPRPAASAAVPASDWETVGDRSANFDRSLAPVADRDEDAITICTHGWTYVVEVTDPDAESPGQRLRRRVENACDHGLTDAYANFLADTAVRLLPACLSIERRKRDSSARVLAACGTFSGDRLAAAEVYNELDEFRGSDESERERYRNLFGGARLDWNGEQITSHADEAWLAKTSELKASFFPRHLHGENATRVIVDGKLEYWTNEGDQGQLWVAPVIMTWEYDQSMGWLMRDARVAEFARTPSNCNPNRLTGGGNC
jgi:hypothetical protein